MKKFSFTRSIMALAMPLTLTLTACHSEQEYQQPSEAEAVTIAEKALGVTIDPDQSWNMTVAGTVEVTADAGIDETEVLILDAYPFGNEQVQSLRRESIKAGQTVTLSYEAPKSLTSVYVAVRNSNNEYRVKRVDIGNQRIWFGQVEPTRSTTTRGTTRRDAVATPTVTEGDYTFNAKLARSWEGINAAVETGTDYNNYFSSIANGYNSWNGSGWNDKYWTVNGSVVESEYTEQDANDIYNAITTAIPEGQDNYTKAVQTGYTVVTKGGPVTLTPIHASSHSNDQISYYYYKESDGKPTEAEIKTMPKYTLGEMGSQLRKTYSLVYVDESGNVSYDFPKGYVINFIVSNTSQKSQNWGTYNSGGITTGASTSSENTVGNSLAKYALTSGESHVCGTYGVDNNQYGNMPIRFGRSDWQSWTGAANPYNDFATATANSAIDGYTAYTTGNGVNGDLTKMGTTVYYVKVNYWNNNIDYLIRAGITINAGKPLYVVELSDFEATSGTVLDGFNGKKYDSKYTGTIEFPAKKDKVYAIYATGSKLGFYGAELFELLSNTTSGSTTNVVWDWTPLKPEYYADGAMNTAVHQHTNGWGLNSANSTPKNQNITMASHNAVFSYNGKNYLGFEDWIDFDYNDLVFEVDGTTGGTSIEATDPLPLIYSYAFEDSRDCDYDLNDVVLKAYEDGNHVILKLVACGATLDLQVRVYANAGDDGLSYGDSYITLRGGNGYEEIHDIMEVDKGTMVNTQAGRQGATKNPYTFYLLKENYDYSKLRLAIWVPEHSEEIRLSEGGQAWGAGNAPYGVRIPGDWKWPKEFINVVNAYPDFATFATDASNTTGQTWYKNNNVVAGSVMDENDL